MITPIPISFHIVKSLKSTASIAWSFTRVIHRPKKNLNSIILLTICGIVSNSSGQQYDEDYYDDFVEEVYNEEYFDFVEGALIQSRCTTPSTEGLTATANPAQWPKINPDRWLYITGLSTLFPDGVLGTGCAGTYTESEYLQIITKQTENIH